MRGSIANRLIFQTTLLVAGVLKMPKHWLQSMDIIGSHCQQKRRNNTSYVAFNLATKTRDCKGSLRLRVLVPSWQKKENMSIVISKNIDELSLAAAEWMV